MNEAGRAIKLHLEAASDSIARTEMHDAWTNVVLADVYIAQGKYNEANRALVSAGGHYRRSQSAVTIEQTDAILEQLTEDVRVTLDRIRGFGHTRGVPHSAL